MNGPQDLDELWRKVERPDLVVIKGDQLAAKGTRAGPGGNRDGATAWLVEAVRVRGQVARDFANLSVELAIVVKGAEPVWAPIRLDGQKLTGAWEGVRDLSLRMVERQEWQVKLTGGGEHRIQVDLRAPVSMDPARKTLSLAIPAALSTSVELGFLERESDIVIGANENFGQKVVGDGKGTRLTAHLSPRSKLDVSWTNNADSGAENPPLLTAQGGIAIDIDLEQMRTRSSWSIRCVRGTTRSLEIRIDDLDEVTELQLDDQAMEAGIERVRGAGKLTIRLAEPLRPGAEKRLVMKTRRSFSSSVARRISFAGFPLTHAREQAGAIGITQSANLWVGAATSQGLRRIPRGELPTGLRARPSTSLAFEFLDQPFLLDLDVEASPPLVRAESRTFFEIDTDQARSETTIELEWVRGRLFEVELGVAAGLQVVSVGPADVVESSHLTNEIAGRDPGGPIGPARRLRIRLTPLGRGQNKVTIRLAGLQRIPSQGSLKLGLFTLDQKSPVNAFYALVADRSLALELEEDSGRLARTSDLKTPFQGPSGDWPWASWRKEMSSPPLFLSDDGNSKYLSIRITRLARALYHDTVLSAHVMARGVDVLQRTTLAVRHGALSSVEIRVPAAIADRWELLEKERMEREELGRESDGARRFRLSFDRPVLDRTTVRFRYRIPLLPGLEARSAREVTIPWISLKEGQSAPAKVGLSLAPEVVLEGAGPGWIRSSDDVRAEPAGEGPVIQFVEGESGREARPFTFKALALETVSLPPFVVPRLLIKTVQGVDDTSRSTAWFWVETHGPDFPFALPENARWIGARVDGRIAGQVDYDPARSHFRLRFPGDVGSRPVLVELEYEGSGPDAASKWWAPRLLDGGVVLQSLWELRVPWSLAVVGVPHGWSDENQWYWTGYVWKRRPWKNVASLNEWILGAGVSTSAIDDLSGSGPDDSDRYLFSRSGQPVVFSVWIVPRSWLVAVCSGATLFVGFFAIFTKIRFRTIWLGVAVLGLLAAAFVQPGVTFLAMQSALIGVVLTIVGLVIEGLIERSKSQWMPARRRSVMISPAAADSSLNRSASVGSDDPTAIRVRVSSTLDFVPAPLAASPIENEARSSSVERA
ncbi:MAG: hypothetical protein ACHRXM_34135 [Isosphaerales bacterium]